MSAISSSLSRSVLNITQDYFDAFVQLPSDDECDNTEDPNCTQCIVVNQKLLEIKDRLGLIESILVHFSSLDTASIGKFCVIPFKGFMSGSQSSISSDRSTSSFGEQPVNSSVKVNIISNVQRNDLDAICTPYYRDNHNLNVATQEAIIREASALFPQLHRRDLLSKVKFCKIV
jgi:hypothetical protein